MTFEMTWPVTVLVDAWPNNALLLTFPHTPASLSLRSIKAYIRTSTIHDASPIAFRFADSLDRTVLTKEMDPARRWRVSSHKNTAIWIFVFQSRRRFFHIFVVVQQWLSNVQKSMMHVQRCCFANLNPLLFCRCLCRLRRRLLSSLKTILTIILTESTILAILLDRCSTEVLFLLKCTY